MAEFSVVAMPLLFLGLLGLDASRWYVARQAVDYALFEAARAGSVHHAAPDAIWTGLERGLIPLLGKGSIELKAAQAEVHAQFERRSSNWRLAPVRMRIVRPGTAHFNDFADPALRVPGYSNRRVIDNDYQQEKHDGHHRKRHRDGLAPASGETVFDANTLTLKLHYLHAPLLPVMGRLLSTLGVEGKDPYLARARALGLIVIERETSMPMQSHAVEFSEMEMDAAAKPGSMAAAPD